MRMTRPRYSVDRRIRRVQMSDKIYYWSIKYQRLIRVTSRSFKSDEPCELCIPLHSALFRRSDLQCRAKLSTFRQLKDHILAREVRFSRPLIWSKRSEIPNVLEREREFGDFCKLDHEPILKFVFETVTMIEYRSNVLIALRKKGCPCLDALPGSRCKMTLTSYRDMWSHLSRLERERSKYIVFKGSADELPINNRLHELPVNNNRPHELPVIKNRLLSTVGELPVNNNRPHVVSNENRSKSCTSSKQMKSVSSDHSSLQSDRLIASCLKSSASELSSLKEASALQLKIKKKARMPEESFVNRPSIQSKTTPTHGNRNSRNSNDENLLFNHKVRAIMKRKSEHRDKERYKKSRNQLNHSKSKRIIGRPEEYRVNLVDSGHSSASGHSSVSGHRSTFGHSSTSGHRSTFGHSSTSGYSSVSGHSSTSGYGSTRFSSMLPSNLNLSSCERIEFVFADGIRIVEVVNHK